MEREAVGLAGAPWCGRAASAALAAALLLLPGGAAQEARRSEEALAAHDGAGAAGLGRPVQAWVDAAVAHELAVIEGDRTAPLRFRMHKVDEKGDVVRIQIETPQGAVARLVERNGQPLTAAEDAAEQERLREVMAHPEEFVRHHKRDAGTRDDTLAVVRQMPAAMVYSYAPGQPQTPTFAGAQVVLDFKPNPAFHPRTLAAEMLTGLEGRLWIDTRSGRMVRAEARVLQPIRFGWGIVGKIYPGGTIALEQANPAGDRWVYSHLEMNLNMRVVVKGMAVHDRMTSSDFEPLPGPVDMQQAVKLLLAMKTPTR